MPQLAALDDQLTIANMPNRAKAVIAGLVFVSALGLYFADFQLLPFPPVVTMQMTGVIIVDSLTALLMLMQFHYGRQLSYAVLGAAYLFPVMLAFPFLLTFPGLALNGAQTLGGDQSSVWLWHVWHVIFPALIGLSAYFRTEIAPEKTAKTLGILVGLVSLCVAVFGAIAIWGAEYLPRLLNIGTQHPRTPLFFGMSGFSALVDGVALWSVWRLPRQKSAIHYWLMVVLVAFMGDILTSMAADHRFTIGWYLSRVQGLFASGVILVFLGAETGKIYNFLRSALSDAYRDRKHLWEDTKMIRVSEERYRLLITQIQDCAITMLDRQGRIVIWNAGAEQVTGYAARQIMGRPLGFLFGQGLTNEQKADGLLAQTLKQSRVETKEWLVRKDGQSVPVRLTVTSLQDAQGGHLGFAVVSWDISQSEDAVIAQSLASQCHDDKTPRANG